MGTTTITVKQFSTMPEFALAGWDPNACDAADYKTDRARALYDALGVKPSDDEYALAKHTDVRWALIGLTVSGHKYAEETMTIELRELDLFEDNAGGLILVSREERRGWRGFERGQNERRLRAFPRDEFTLATDARIFDELGEGSAYEPIDPAEVEDLYEHDGETNRARRVASWDEIKGVIVHRGSLGAAARWYLAGSIGDA